MKAIEIGEKLLKDPVQNRDANLHVWMACAYGQQYKFFKQQNKADDELAQVKEKVATEIKMAIDLMPAARGWLRSFWKPEPGSKEDDLNAFPQNDPVLSALLNL